MKIKKRIMMIILSLMLFIVPISAESNHTEIDNIFGSSTKIGSIPNNIEDINFSIEDLDKIYNTIDDIVVLDQHDSSINSKLKQVKHIYISDKQKYVHEIYTRIALINGLETISARGAFSRKGTIVFQMYSDGTFYGKINTTIWADDVDGVMQDFGTITAVPIKTAAAEAAGLRFYVGEKKIPWLHKFSPLTYRFEAKPYFLTPNHTWPLNSDLYPYVKTYDVVVN